MAFSIQNANVLKIVQIVIKKELHTAVPQIKIIVEKLAAIVKVLSVSNVTFSYPDIT